MKRLSIAELMETSGVGFGTSGARGLVERMTDEVCYSYTVAFLQYLEHSRGLGNDTPVAIAGDLRPSTERILTACAAAIRDRGHPLIHAGRIASPAIAFHGLTERIPTLMVTGSHIPDDRNGIKFNHADGEILKADEAGIRAQRIELPPDRFTPEGSLRTAEPLPPAQNEAEEAYIRRYLEFFPPGCLAGRCIGLYEHSSVIRDTLYQILSGLGAEVTRLGRSERFIPVDTEAIRREDTELARQWAMEHRFDCIVSADGDGDRPLISDENGEWLRGDIAGILCARYLHAHTVVTPVSSNSAVERSGWFSRVIRTRIGSPFVIAAMEEALANGGTPVVGYEANGGFLTGSDIEREERRLKALPTRDATLVILAILEAAREKDRTISQLLTELPQRFTASDRIREFPTEQSRARLAWLRPQDETLARERIQATFGRHFGKVATIDDTDGLRITFANGEVVHLRPSGNAPELRCYNEADSRERVETMQEICMQILEGWKGG